MVETKSASDIEKMRAAGRVAREVLDATGREVKVGVTTDFLDDVAHAATIERGAYPSPLNYHGYPKSICTSVNEVICHGIPDDIPLKAGDVINVDVTVFLDGFHGDCSEMFYVGDVDDRSVSLVEATYDCWQARGPARATDLDSPSVCSRGTPRRGRDPPSTTALPPAGDRAAPRTDVRPRRPPSPRARRAGRTRSSAASSRTG